MQSMILRLCRIIKWEFISLTRMISQTLHHSSIPPVEIGDMSHWSSLQATEMFPNGKRFLMNSAGRISFRSSVWPHKYRVTHGQFPKKILYMNGLTFWINSVG